MTDWEETALEQLTNEVALIIEALTPFVGDQAVLVEARCGQIVDDMSSDDEVVVAEACTSVLMLLWSRALPEDCGHADWWQSPLGRLLARWFGREDPYGDDEVGRMAAEMFGHGRSVTQHVAAAMLGVTRGTVAQMVHRGTLDRHPDGGVLRSSVMARLAR